MSMPPLEGESEFFEALGRAIAAWQNIEVALAYLFAAAMPEPKATRSLIVFDTVQNFRDKLSITDAVLRETLIDAPCLETWMEHDAQQVAALSQEAQQDPSRPCRANPRGREDAPVRISTIF